MTIVDRSSPIPLYVQLKQILLERIRQQEWQAGELIPSEARLEETYDLSRITVRQALASLVQEGYLDRQRGRGTFVKQPKFMHDPAKRLALTDTMLEQGISPGWRVLSADWADLPEDLAERFKASSKWFCIQRLRLANDEAIGFHIAFVPETVTSFMNEALLEEGGSLNYLQAVPDFQDSRAGRTLEALEADKLVAKQLNIKLKKPILRIERTTKLNGSIVEFMQASYRGDRFKYHIDL